MTEKQYLTYTRTVKRLARGGIEGPTEQIIALAEEIERYRDKIYALEEQPQKAPPQKAPPAPFHKFRLTQYDPDLDRFVVPLLFRPYGDSITFSVKIGKTYTSQSITGEIYTGKEPDIVFGEIIDRLAELENREEQNYDA